MDNMSGARLRTQQKSCQSGREVVWPLPFPLPSHLPSCAPHSWNLPSPAKDFESFHFSLWPFTDQSVVLRLGDEAGGCHPFPGEISPFCGSLLPDLYPQELGE